MHPHVVGAVVAKRRQKAASRAQKGAEGKGLAQEDEDFISEMFAQYDANDDGGLQESEIHQLMNDLNDGNEVPLETVQEYIARYDKNQSGKIDKREVRKLVAAWYINISDAKNAESGCCVIS